MKIVVSEFMDESGLALLRETPDLHLVYEPQLVKDTTALYTRLSDADALIVRNQTQVNAELVATAPNLKIVGRLGVGLDNIGLETLKEHNIALVVPYGANANAVAEWTLGAILTLARRFVPATASTIGGKWERTLYGGTEIAGKTLALVGFGDIARRVARRALAFDMKIATYDPYLTSEIMYEWGGYLTRYETLGEMLPVANFVSLHVPHTPETANLLSAERLALLPDGAFVINSARGGLLDEAALLSALQTKKLGGAALDVRETEPPSQPDPLAEPTLNLLLTPHVAGLTAEAQKRISVEVAEGILKSLVPSP
jgi:D-3-phosphoglycerate dehydrogenase